MILLVTIKRVEAGSKMSIFSYRRNQRCIVSFQPFFDHENTNLICLDFQNNRIFMMMYFSMSLHRARVILN